MQTASKNKLTALVITYNEMGYIERCIDSVRFADEIIVVDSYSSDGTYEFLQKDPDVNVFQHPFENFTICKTGGALSKKPVIFICLPATKVQWCLLKHKFPVKPEGCMWGI